MIVSLMKYQFNREVVLIEIFKAHVWVNDHYNVTTIFQAVTR